jgi:hypothetical protein
LIAASWQKGGEGDSSKTEAQDLVFGREGALAIIQFQKLSMKEAEQCVAEMWVCFEECDIPTPSISFQFGHPSHVSFTVGIIDPVAAAAVLARCSTWLEPRTLRFDSNRGPRAENLTQSESRLDRIVAPIDVVIAAAASA